MRLLPLYHNVVNILWSQLLGVVLNRKHSQRQTRQNSLSMRCSESPLLVQRHTNRFSQPPCLDLTSNNRDFFSVTYFSFIYAVVARILFSSARQRCTNSSWLSLNLNIQDWMYSKHRTECSFSPDVLLLCMFWKCDLVRLIPRGHMPSDEWPWRAPRYYGALTSGHLPSPFHKEYRLLV